MCQWIKNPLAHFVLLLERKINMDLKNKIKSELLSFADPALLTFEQSLNMKSEDETVKQIGIRVPLLRNYAKELSKEYELDFLFHNIDEEYYEELMLKGFLISSYKNLSYQEFERIIMCFVPKINDWGICDTFCASLKLTKKYQREFLKVIKKYLKSQKEFEVRFALVMILDYYIDEEHLNQIYEIINDVKLDKYYVKMANAWLISFCIIKYYDKTVAFLKNDCKIDDFTYNKGLQKSIESYRVSNQQKEELRLLKRK